MLRRAIAAAILGAALCAAPPAFANTYTVTAAVGDGPGTCGNVVNGAATCPTLRAAFTQAISLLGSQSIVLGVTGTYGLTQGALTVPTGNHNVTVSGPDARLTTIQASGSQVFTVTPGTTLQLSTLNVSGGTTTGTGGNILNQGTLNVDRVRVFGGTAGSGGGVANVGGVATITNSLIDDNTANGGRTAAAGGGILNQIGSGTTAIPSTLTVQNSTIAFNHLSGTAEGAGIANLGGGAQAFVTSVSVVRNTADATTGGGAGIYDASGGNIAATSVSASIVADNTASTTTADCGGLKLLASGQNISTSSGCGFSTTADPLVDTTYTNQGGQTDVFVTLPGSPARRLVASCPVATDQRGVARTQGGACDAGAYESPAPQPQPSPSPSPTPTPTPTPSPTPVFHKSVVVTRVSGTVKVKLPGTNKFVDISKVQSVPLGATIDVKHGKIDLTSVPKAGGKPQTALFYGGIFKITQPGGITQLQLTETLAACPRGRAASVAAKKPKTRSLWGDGHGSFRTKGRYSAATVRGTKWLVEDSCAGTLTKVAHGVVSVRDDVRHKNITLRAGKKYLARPRR